jgi:hypothetical protein
MYFCPKCNYSFDISKSITSDNEDNKYKLDTPDIAIQKIKSGKSLEEYSANFKLDDLESNKLYETLSDDEKIQLNSLFTKPASNISGIMFKCNNCNYNKKIKETIKLYQMNVDSIYSVFRSLDDNKLLSLNPIYPRTKDYICKNINCITHKDTNKKEAVFFREKDSYLTNYICAVCYNSWKI